MSDSVASFVAPFRCRAILKPLTNISEIHILAFILAAFQIFDGLLTLLGVHRFGSAIEANLLLRWTMEEIGRVNALLVFKLTAIAFVFVLFRLSSEISWIKPAMRFLVTVYLFGAIIPWGFMLFPGVT